MKQNCWEVKSCGKCTTILGDDACPVCKEVNLHGIHDGVNGGRACWTISHTRCGGTTQGTFESKFHNCKECDFYKLVMKDLQGSFQLQCKAMSNLLLDIAL